MKTSDKFYYLCKKINWNASFLDAEAIQYLNEIGKEIKTLELQREISTNESNT